MESRERERVLQEENRNRPGPGRGSEKAWNCLGYCSVPASSLALSPSHGITQLPKARAHGGNCLMLYLQLLPCPRRGVG